MMGDYEVVDAPPEFVVFTIIPYAGNPEYRKYEVDVEDLGVFLDGMENESHAERVVWVRPKFQHAGVVPHMAENAPEGQE